MYSFVCLGYCVFEPSIIKLCKSSLRPHKFPEKEFRTHTHTPLKHCVISLFLIEQQQQTHLVFNIPFDMRKVVQILENSQ